MNISGKDKNKKKSTSDLMTDEIHKLTELTSNKQSRMEVDLKKQSNEQPSEKPKMATENVQSKGYELRYKREKVEREEKVDDDDDDDDGDDG